VQLQPLPSSDPEARDVASALEGAAARLGHQPAVTVLFPSGRQEQSVASLAQWAAKGAHLLELDLLLEPGERVHLDAPASWTSAAVALAVWWAGCELTLDGDADVAVLHEDRAAPTGASEVLRIGDAIDGTPRATTSDEAWARAVQAFPDQPPVARGHADAPALRSGERTFDQAGLLRVASGQGQGRGGVEAGVLDPVDELVAAALRPLVAGRATVVLRGVARGDADGERVSTWLT
jgi:uncharacterized protein (TIGR03089 family)